jgi:hypothetical protein
MDNIVRENERKIAMAWVELYVSELVKLDERYKLAMPSLYQPDGTTNG